MQVSSYYYDVLGLRPGSGIKDIKKAYRTLVRKNHPDLFPDNEKELQELKMIHINEAYTRLIDDYYYRKKGKCKKQLDTQSIVSIEISQLYDLSDLSSQKLIKSCFLFICHLSKNRHTKICMRKINKLR